MKILITGSHGFVGTNLIEALSGEHEIVRWDIRSDEALPSDIDAVIHLAGKAHDTKNRSQAGEYFEVNTELTKKIYDAFLRSSAQKFIYFSSIKAVAEKTDGKIVDESWDPHPVGTYGESKLAAEAYIRTHEGKQTYILRPCMIHGKGNKGNLNLLCKFVKHGLPWPLAGFENKRSFLSMDNLVFVIKQLLEKDIQPGTYHLADDEALSTNELVKLIGDAQGKRFRMWRIHPQIIRGVAQMGDWFRLPLNCERLRKLTEDYVVSNKKIKGAFGIDRLPVDAKIGLMNTIKEMINS